MMGRVEEAKKLIAEGANVDAVDKVRCALFYSMPAGVHAGLPALSQQLNVARCDVCPLTGARNRVSCASACMGELRTNSCF
jgi:hypothetical protein